MAEQLFLDAPSLGSLLPSELFARLRAAGTSIVYQDKALIQARGDARPGLSIIREGAVQIGNPGLDGSFVVTSILGPGHCFGEMTLFGDLPRTHDAVAKGATVIDHVSPAAYERFAEANPALTRAMLGMMARRLYATLEFADDLRRLPLKVQLAKLLLSMVREGRARATHEELGARFGVSRVAIGTALGVLESEGLVKRSYGGIEVPDRAALQRWIEHRTMLAPVRG
ncbi:MAG: Transcriptional regulator, Crp/Fnr family [Sphingomonas bacterium]|uniref:Crp/Fnr family transcriptional regulator n=1 Tax=Sphingomonas bacterium TaxID=1895847 RepID=UPI0026154FFA|nr:Crp/Fnr family transcriptional regulator [Sphingomonas bacterium]MDB5706295.1 Transcriptional regulator, Crp/Fnr family [Sphingomonas bacterium]